MSQRGARDECALRFGLLGEKDGACRRSRIEARKDGSGTCFVLLCNIHTHKKTIEILTYMFNAKKLMK